MAAQSGMENTRGHWWIRSPPRDGYHPQQMEIRGATTEVNTLEEERRSERLQSSFRRQSPITETAEND